MHVTPQGSVTTYEIHLQHWKDKEGATLERQYTFDTAGGQPHIIGRRESGTRTINRNFASPSLCAYGVDGFPTERRRGKLYFEVCLKRKALNKHPIPRVIPTTVQCSARSPVQREDRPWAAA